MTVGEWDQRQLCPDGGCVGVIGPDGTCKVCGRAAQNWGDERTRGLLDPPDERDPPAAADLDGGGAPGDDVVAGDVAEVSTPAIAGSSSSDWGSRMLCRDGSCIGVIGPDGTCKICGRAALESSQDAPPTSAAASTAEPAAGDRPSDPAGPADTPDEKVVAG
ncbi:MAG TPA: hypothetical protein VHN14_15110 [Kofleriaceae bacterium]|jgi:hypothetical protein|nr:hypothetical protein [Kofleriaceae bacterium]